MSKRVKLAIDFNDAACLEVEYAPNKKARVTYTSFRSFCGRRFINNVEYFGPVYYEGTNYRYKVLKSDKSRIVSVDELNIKRRKTKKHCNAVVIGSSGRL